MTIIKNNAKSIFIYGLSIILKSTRSKIIYYHDVHSNKKYSYESSEISTFLRHIELIKLNGYKIAPDIKNIFNEIEIHFDDGNRGIFENFDFLIERKIPIKLFVITNKIGSVDFLNTHEIEQLINSGLVELGSHTINHLNLNELSDPKLRYELEYSKKTLEDRFGINISNISFPRGHFSNNVIIRSIEAGYKNLYSSVPGDFDNKLYGNVSRRNLVGYYNKYGFLGTINGYSKFMANRILKQTYSSN